MTATRTRVGIVEDHTLLAQSVGFALRANGVEVVVASLDDEDALLASLAPDETLLVMLDLDLGEPLGDGGRLVRPLREAGAAVLLVTGSRDMMRVAAAVEDGAVGFVAKDEPFDVLLDVALRAAAGERVMSENDRYQLLHDLRRHRAELHDRLAPLQSLTPREREVLAGIADGKSVDTIAREWVVSEATVRTQVRGVLTKLDVRSQLAAVAKARAAGWTFEP
jgi:two-component system nitrate/nitrite response regulator NarL